MGFILSLLSGFIPAFIFAWFIYWLDRYEKEPNKLLGFSFLWGALVASGSAWLFNTIFGMGVYLFTGSETTTNITTGSLIAPIVEESLKGLAVLIVYLRYRNEFDSILDGIIYAAITALGFTATENAFYIYNYGYLEGGFTGLLGLAIVRVILVGWQHAFYTSFIGIGLAIARLNRSTLIKLLAPSLAWCLAVLTHSLHNTLSTLLQGQLCLLGTLIDWSGWVLMLAFTLWVLVAEQRNMASQLREEIEMGTITQLQYQTACSAWAAGLARLEALFTGKHRQTATFYQLCGELAHKKRQLAQLGDETGNQAAIQDLRQKLAGLSMVIKN